MSFNPVEFSESNADSDRYILSFKLNPAARLPIYSVISESIHYRIGKLMDEAGLNVLTLTVKADCFKPENCTTGFIEMDMLFQTESMTSFDVYLYDHHEVLKAKASCTIQYEKEVQLD